MNAPTTFPSEAEFGVIRTRECEDGWFEAECQLSRPHPWMVTAGKTLKSALDQMDRRIKYWERWYG